MNKGFFKSKKNIISLCLIAVLVILMIWFNLFYFKSCGDKNCFYTALKDCQRARFILDENMTFEYKILGLKDNNCEINVKLLDGALFNKDLIKIKGKEMTCSLPFRVLMQPESDISLCHGELKEGFQDLIINKLHVYLVQNLGEINSELLKV